LSQDGGICAYAVRRGGRVKDPHEIRVLVVEDDYLVGEMIKGRLMEIGYAIAGEASNGVEAVEMTESLQPDIVLMDIQMPQMDGIEATRRIIERRATPVVALTAYETTELVHKASEAGVSAYLVKPPSVREMERTITVAIDRFQDAMELRRLNVELEEAIAQVKALTGLLPICVSCKKIRDDHGYWHRVEAYIEEHSEAEFSHGICPGCASKLYPDFFQPDTDGDKEGRREG